MSVCYGSKTDIGHLNEYAASLPLITLANRPPLLPAGELFWVHLEETSIVTGAMLDPQDGAVS